MSESNSKRSRHVEPVVPPKAEDIQPKLRRMAHAFGGEDLSPPHQELVTLLFGDVGDLAEHIGSGETLEQAPATGAEGDLWLELVREAFDLGPNHLSTEQAAELLARRPHHLCLLRAMLDDTETIPVPWITAIDFMASRSDLL